METEKKSSTLTTGQRVWLWSAVVISVIVLALSAIGIIGTWIVRGAAIDLNNSLMDGVSQIASTGSATAEKVKSRVNEVNTNIAEIESAVNDVSQNIADKGVLLTVLPPEKEENLVSKVTQIRETAETITSAVSAALDLYKSINAIPFVSLPKPEEGVVQEIQTGVQDMQTSVQELTDSIHEFRDNASARVDRVANAVGNAKDRLQKTEDNLDRLSSELTTLQTSAQNFKSTFATLMTVLTLIITLFLAWVIYGMVILIMKNWAELKR